jgi:hypothetical protein
MIPTGWGTCFRSKANKQCQQIEFWHSSATVRSLCREPGRYPRNDTLHHKTHSTTHGSSNPGLERAGDLLRLQYPKLVISERKRRQADAIQMIRQKRESEAQNLGFSSRPFVLCGLPVKRPPDRPNPRKPEISVQIGHPAPRRQRDRPLVRVARCLPPAGFEPRFRSIDRGEGDCATAVGLARVRFADRVPAHPAQSTMR